MSNQLSLLWQQRQVQYTNSQRNLILIQESDADSEATEIYEPPCNQGHKGKDGLQGCIHEKKNLSKKGKLIITQFAPRHFIGNHERLVCSECGQIFEKPPGSWSRSRSKLSGRSPNSSCHICLAERGKEFSDEADTNSGKSNVFSLSLQICWEWK